MKKISTIIVAALMMAALPAGAQVPAKRIVDVKVVRDRSKDALNDSIKKSFVGRQFTDLEEADVNGQMHKLSEYVGKGRWLLVDFWASWPVIFGWNEAHVFTDVGDTSIILPTSFFFLLTAVDL